jgi:FkbM family methyltransferase
MNYGGGGLIETSGEAWVLANVVRSGCQNVTTPVVFDVGANVGDYTRLVKQHMPVAQVYAFEPSHATYQQLVNTHGLANTNGIRSFNFGFSDAEGTVELYSYKVEGEEQSLLSSIDRRLPTQVVNVETAGSEHIEVKTIDSFCTSNGIERIDFLKLDVEGHELAVLRGASRMLGESRISMIQFEFGPANIYSRTFFYDFWTLLAEGFRIYRIVPNGLAPLNYYGEHLEIFLTTNYLAISKRIKS